MAITTDLESGYNVEQERAAAVERLKTLGMTLVTDPMLKRRDITGDGQPETFCNWAAARAANFFGCKDLDGKSANEQARHLEFLRSVISEGSWEWADGERATAHAMKGGLCFAVKEYMGAHGHIALVAPEPMEHSGSWGKKVPMLYNVGKINGLMKASMAFPVDLGEPSYYALGRTAV